MLGSNQRRLSRRFYSPSLLAEADAADQRIRASRCDSGPPPSAMRPCEPGSGAVKATDGGAEATDGAGRSGYADRPPGFCPLTWHFRLRLDIAVSLVYGVLLGVPGGGGAGDPPVGGISLPVDAVGVDLEQDGDGGPGAASYFGGGQPGVQPGRDGGVPQVVEPAAKRRPALTRPLPHLRRPRSLRSSVRGRCIRRSVVRDEGARAGL